MLRHADGSPFAPNTVGSSFRTLFSEFKRQNVPWKLCDFKGWDGAVFDVVDQIWADYQKQDNNFGLKKKEEFTDDDFDTINKFIASLDEETRCIWQPEITYFATGASFGFRGIQEHHDLKISDIIWGKFPSTAAEGLANKPFVKIRGEMLHKANKLTFCKYQ